MKTLYKTYAQHLAEHFEGKVQKITVNAGLGCPNRDGTVGEGGCTYCDNRSFSPDYCQPKLSVAEQLRRGRDFFAHKYPAMRYLAYFQSFTNTYAPLSKLQRIYEEALSQDGIVGLVIATRPDCVNESLLNYLGQLARETYVMVEYGVESVCDATLQRINRGHNFACSRRAIEETAAWGVHTGAHVIVGLPGEGRTEILLQADELSRLPIETLKLHQLQIIKGTRMEQEYQRAPDDFLTFTPQSYAELVLDYLEHLRDDIAVERFTNQSPPELLATKGWGLKNHEFLHLLQAVARQRYGIHP